MAGKKQSRRKTGGRTKNPMNFVGTQTGRFSSRVKQEGQALGRATETDLSQHPMISRDSNVLRQMQTPPMPAPYLMGAKVLQENEQSSVRDKASALINGQTTFLQKLDQERREKHRQLAACDPRGADAVELVIQLSSVTLSWIRELTVLLNLTDPEKKNGPA